ncbi:hypothetical protein N7539_009550 [Penicillium diatomitis]|uniref:Uncharacterized protein n=1 Tax=Penicillium diatomitis TaxID=2819901 RepID=A0A9W9WK96_9EURO|nr:uncharacterized protein N7539_009550 [Penicillium diatomitis]KAJ5466594.1 hypothetical protein N7539_009550 [Penicillium diatomitis]
MSGSPSTKAGKNMSSRLLTMKRAAASAAAKEPQIPAATDDDDKRAKKPRLSTEAEGSRTSQSDLEAMSAAMAAEEAKRREAIARQAAEAGESEWVLDIPYAPTDPQPIVLSADSLDAEDDLPQGGRRAYGNFTRKKPSAPVATTKAEASADDEDEDDESDYESGSLINPADPEAVAAHIEKLRQKALAKEQRRKDALAHAERKRLSGLTSISGSQKATYPSMGSQSAKKKKKRKF